MIEIGFSKWKCRMLGLCMLVSLSTWAQQNKKDPGWDWYFRDPSDDSLAGISLYKAYDLLKDRKATTIIVAVIDNGFDLDHEDLKQNIWTNTKEIPGNGIDDDHNGYTDDIHGWNFRGAQDGTTNVNDQAEATRVYSLWKNVYGNTDTVGFSKARKSEWLMYQNAKKEYLEKSRDPNETTEDRMYYYNPAFNARKGVDHADSISERYYGGTGIASLLLSYFPSLSAAQVKEILLKSVYIPRNPVNRPGSSEKVAFNSLSVSGGIVNAYQAIQMAMKMTAIK